MSRDSAQAGNFNKFCITCIILPGKLGFGARLAGTSTHETDWDSLVGATGTSFVGAAPGRQSTLSTVSSFRLACPDALPLFDEVFDEDWLWFPPSWKPQEGKNALNF
ncbi:MAG: hypothetical protein AB1861_01155 [Cyanobacteriota bacterium]